MYCIVEDHLLYIRLKSNRDCEYQLKKRKIMVEDRQENYARILKL